MFDDEIQEGGKSGKRIAVIVAVVVCAAAVLIGAVIWIFWTVNREKGGIENQGTEGSVDNDPGNDNPGNDNPDNADPGNDNPGNADPGNDNPGNDDPVDNNPGTGDNTGDQGTGTEGEMKFQEVSETVTAKDVTNLRNIPSQGADSTVLRQLSNGEIATRTGISDRGWSRLVLDGTTYYAVSNYLTTDLSARPPKPEDDGIKTKFTDCREQVTPKIEVNLRSIPSVTNPNSVVVATVYAEKDVFLRTGINTELGWSRVEYNGQILYCVSSYLKLAE